MLPGGLTQWIVCALVAQAPADDAWLKAIPADIEIVVHVASVERVRDHATALSKAMSSTFGPIAEQALQSQFSTMLARLGNDSVRRPVVMLGNVPGPADADATSTTTLVLGGDYATVLRGFNAGNHPDVKSAGEGIETFQAPYGGNKDEYAGKGNGFIVVGESKSIVAALIKPRGKTLGDRISPAQKKTFLSGDIGVYVNTSALASRFSEEIEQGRALFFAAIDQAAALQNQNAGLMEFTKTFYGDLFDSIKDTDGLAVGLDASKDGLSLSSLLTMKAGSAIAKEESASQAGGADLLAKLASGGDAYITFDVNAKTIERMQNLSLKMMSKGDKISPALEKATARFHSLGRLKVSTAMTFAKGMRFASAVSVKDPAEYIEACQAMLVAMTKQDGGPGYYKDVTIDPDVKSVGGWKFRHIHVEVDTQAMAAIGGGDPAMAERMNAMFGSDKLDYWYGTDGKTVLQLTAKSWREVETTVKAYLAGGHAVGESEGFRRVQSKLPSEANAVFLLSAQGMLRLLGTAINAAQGLGDGEQLKLPAGMPKEAVYVGFSLGAAANNGYQFHLMVPSSLGPVIEKGYLPFIQANGGGKKVTD